MERQIDRIEQRVGLHTPEGISDKSKMQMERRCLDMRTLSGEDRVVMGKRSIAGFLHALCHLTPSIITFVHSIVFDGSRNAFSA